MNFGHYIHQIEFIEWFKSYYYFLDFLTETIPVKLSTLLKLM